MGPHSMPVVDIGLPNYAHHDYLLSLSLFAQYLFITNSTYIYGLFIPIRTYSDIYGHYTTYSDSTLTYQDYSYSFTYTD